MTRPLVVVRPEPGNSRTCDLINASGHRAIALPLFRIVPIDWTPPDTRSFDALMLTSANAVRMAGGALHRYRALPVVAVGVATASAAHAAGLSVTVTGNDNAVALIEIAKDLGCKAVLHLAGRDRAASDPIITPITVYASEPDDIDDRAVRRCTGTIVLLHSARAGARFAALVDRSGAQRETIRIAALSTAVLESAGAGWAAGASAAMPCDRALVALAITLAD